MERSKKKPKNINYYRAIAIKTFKLKDKGMHGWKGLARAVYLCINCDFKKFRSDLDAKIYVMRVFKNAG